MIISSFLTGTLVIGNIKAISLPADSIFFSFLDRVDQRLHALVIVRVGFHQIDNVESVNLIFACVLDSEEVPLGKAIGAIIVFKKQIVLKIIDFHSFP